MENCSASSPSCPDPGYGGRPTSGSWSRPWPQQRPSAGPRRRCRGTAVHCPGCKHNIINTSMGQYLLTDTDPSIIFPSKSSPKLLLAVETAITDERTNVSSV